MRWLFLSLLPAVHGVCDPDSAKVLQNLEGVIKFKWANASVATNCRWHLYPNRRLRGIQFNTTIRFGAGDSLLFYGTRDVRPGQYIGRFGLSNPLPASMVLTGTDEATIIIEESQMAFVTSAGESYRVGTEFELRYRCIVQDYSLFSMHVSPLWLAVWVGMWMLFISLCCASTSWVIRYRRAEHVARVQAERRAALALAAAGEDLLNGSDSVLLLHAELLRRRELERLRAREALEADMESALRALPTVSWSDRSTSHRPSQAGDGKGGGSSSADAGDECCLCMEPFERDEMIRLLP